MNTVGGYNYVVSSQVLYCILYFVLNLMTNAAKMRYNINGYFYIMFLCKNGCKFLKEVF